MREGGIRKKAGTMDKQNQGYLPFEVETFSAFVVLNSQHDLGSSPHTSVLPDFNVDQYTSQVHKHLLCVGQGAKCWEDKEGQIYPQGALSNEEDDIQTTTYEQNKYRLNWR